MGFKILYIADYLETDPLAKAEWIKVFGALYGKEELSDSLFRKIVDEYSIIRSHVLASSPERPKVLLGLPWKDTWYISPGNSFISKLITDAGGDYLWADTESEVSMPYGIESVYLRALNADCWLNAGAVFSKREITGLDPRLEDLPPFKEGRIFNNNNRISETGGNDYWESGSMMPQVILKDIAAILHPELYPGHELYFYRRVGN
jgi:iron complex transport system substrate-binding protein